MSQIFNLNRLQNADTRLDALQKRLREIEDALDNHEAIQTAEAVRQSTQEKLAQAQQALRRAEDLLQSARNKKALNQQKLYGGRVTNPKALQDLQEEAAALDRRIAALEDDLLEAMLVSESAENDFQAADAALQRLRDEIARQQADMLKEREKLTADAARESAQRDLLRKQIPADLLALYDQLRESKKGLAVTLVQGSNCAACGAGLPPAIIQQARQGGGAARCPVCKRILYAG